MHFSTKFSPNQIFYIEDHNLLKEVLENIKKTFKSRENLEQNFKECFKAFANKEKKI